MSEVMGTGRIWAARARLEGLIAEAVKQDITLSFDLQMALIALNSYERIRDLVESKTFDVPLSREEVWAAIEGTKTKQE